MLFTFGRSNQRNHLQCHGDHLQSSLTPWRKYASHVKVRGISSKMDLNINSSQVRTLHGRVNITLVEVRRNYWIPKGRQQVNVGQWDCVICKKFQGKSFLRPQVGDLPSIEIIQARPFEKAGVDFAGPMSVKENGRSENTNVAILSCTVTRADAFSLGQGPVNQLVQKWIEEVHRSKRSTVPDDQR